MVLGSFQCRGVLLLLHMVEHGSAVLAAGVGFILFFISLPLSRSKPAQEQCKLVNDRIDTTLAVDRAVKPQHKQTKTS